MTAPINPFPEPFTPAPSMWNGQSFLQPAKEPLLYPLPPLEMPSLPLTDAKMQTLSDSLIPHLQHLHQVDSQQQQKIAEFIFNLNHDVANAKELSVTVKQHVAQLSDDLQIYLNNPIALNHQAILDVISALGKDL